MASCFGSLPLDKYENGLLDVIDKVKNESVMKVRIMKLLQAIF